MIAGGEIVASGWPTVTPGVVVAARGVTGVDGTAVFAEVNVGGGGAFGAVNVAGTGAPATVLMVGDADTPGGAPSDVNDVEKAPTSPGDVEGV